MLGGVITQTKIPPPAVDCERVARALIWAATLTREVGTLIKHDEAALAGRVELRARWIAFAALQAAGEGPINALGRALGCGMAPLYLLERQRQRAGWREDLVTAVTVSLLCDEDLVAPAGVERQVMAALDARS